MSNDLKRTEAENYLLSNIIAYEWWAWLAEQEAAYEAYRRRFSSNVSTVGD